MQFNKLDTDMLLDNRRHHEVTPALEIRFHKAQSSTPLNFAHVETVSRFPQPTADCIGNLRKRPHIQVDKVQYQEKPEMQVGSNHLLSAIKR